MSFMVKAEHSNLVHVADVERVHGEGEHGAEGEAGHGWMALYTCTPVLRGGRVLLAKWSGQMGVPMVGQTVEVAINAIGAATVVGWFVEHGYLGVLVKPHAPPDWYVKQNGPGSTCHVFGTELR